MQNEPSQPPASDGLKRLQQPAQNSIRGILRIVGPMILVVGLLCTIGGGVSFFSAFGGDGPPRFFWLCFIGLPLMFVGGVLSQFGFMGAVVRYIAGENAPVAADTVNYMADETKGAVETVAKSAAKGVAEGLEAAGAPGGFCPGCGVGVKTEFKFCPKCGVALEFKGQ